MIFKILNSLLKKVYFLSVFLEVILLQKQIVAQQQGQSSLYFFNQHFFNPAYISINKGVTITASGRNQWVSFKGAPQAANISIYSSLGNNIAGGFSIQTDKIGANQTSTFMGNFGYEISFKKKKRLYAIKLLETPRANRDVNHLAFGLSFGANYYQTSYSDLRIVDVNDEVYQDGITYSQTTMNVGFGLMYYNSIRFLGISMPTLIQNKLSPNALHNATEKRHLYVVGGFLKELSNGLVIRPSAVVKIVANAPIAFDANLSVLLKKQLWLGILFKNNPALGLNMLYVITPNFRIGYAYEQQLTSMQRYSSGSHEIMIGYQITNKKKHFLVNCPKF